MTRDEILNLKIGDYLIHTINGRSGKPAKVVEIFAQEVSNYHGRAYVCFYTEFGPTSRISGSAAEGENYYQLAK